jgi:hypothetical protein
MNFCKGFAQTLTNERKRRLFFKKSSNLKNPHLNEENLGSWWQGLAYMDFLDFWYVISRDQIKNFETPSFFISALFKIITPP